MADAKGKLLSLRAAAEGEGADEGAELVRLHLRVSRDVAEALALGKVRGLGTISEQVENLVRERERTEAGGKRARLGGR